VVRYLIAATSVDSLPEPIDDWQSSISFSMACTIFAIELPGKAKLGIMAKPRGGDWLDAEIESVSSQRFQIVVSLLEDSEVKQFELDQEAEACSKKGLEFVHLPIRDMTAPPLSKEVLDTLGSLRQKWGAGKAVVVHCKMAYGRAPTIAAALMISEGCSVEEAVHKLSQARGTPVPETNEQRSWLSDFSKLTRASKKAK
jgi:protein-tyrosine phosphatase